jgi:hypothetical protein
MIIKRDFTRTPHDDFVLHVEDKLNKFNEYYELFDPETGVLTGWNICWRFE